MLINFKAISELAFIIYVLEQPVVVGNLVVMSSLFRDSSQTPLMP